MGLVNITGFQRARRLAAEKAEAERKKELNEALNEYANGSESGQTDPGKVNDQVDPENPAAGENEGQNDDPIDVDAMDIEDVKAKLDELEIKYAHNTGEAKLRERLADAING